MAYDAKIRVGTEVDASEVEKKLVKELDKAERKLDSLYEKSKKFDTLGVNSSSKQFESLMYDIEQAEEKVREAEEALKSFRQQQEKSEKITFGEALQNAANLVKSSFKMFGNAILHPVETMKTLANSARNVGNILRKAFSGGLKIMKSLLNPMKTIRSLMGKINTQGEKTGNTFSKTAGKLRGIAFSMLAFNAVYKVMNTVVTAFREGFQNIAGYSKETNKAMSEFKGQAAQLKNSLATAFVPIVNNILPILTNLISWINKACDAMARFMAFMSGKSTYTKAKEQVVDYTESLDKASGAAKEAAKSLAAFDELNVLSDNSSGSGSSGTDVSDMFEEADIGEVSDFAQSMKEAIEKGDWYGAGKLLAQKINEMLVQVDFSQFDLDIQNKISSIVSGVNGLVENLEWSLLGQRIAEGLNIVIHSLETFLETMDWKSLGSGIVSGITSVISNIDFGSIAASLSAFVSGVLEFLTGAIQGVDWSTIPGIIIKIFSDFFNNFNYTSVFSSVGGFIGAAIAAGIDLLKGIGDVLAGAWDAVVEYFSGYIELSGGDIVLGLLTGIIEALKNIGKWIINNIFKPFIEGFKSAFEIHSPSKAMSKMGKYLIKGLLNGIKETWKEIKTFFSEKLGALKTSITNKLSNIVEVWNKKWTSIKENLSGICKEIKTKISETVSNMKTKISEVLTGKSGIVGIWKEAFGSLKSTASTTFDTIWTKIKSVLQSILNGIGSMVNKAIDTINGLIGSLNKFGFDLPDIMGGGHIGFNIQKMSKITVPQLAEGAVIKGGNPFMAILGDQRAGQTNIETPLPTMVKAFKQALAESEAFGGDVTFIAELDGRVLFKETLRQAELYRNRTGKTLPI